MSPPEPSASQLRVLVVEDSLVNQKLLSGMLARLECVVTLVADGKQGVDKISQEEFDVVLMDVQMPVMDGLEATRLIREQENGNGKHTPIIAVTAGMDEDTCLEAGMDCFLAKPVRPQLLYDTLLRLLGGSHGQ